MAGRLRVVLAVTSVLVASFVAVGGASGLRSVRTTRVSLTADGGQANGSNDEVGMSTDGRLLVLSSGASNLVPGDTNGSAPHGGNDVFVRDRGSGRLTRVSVSSDGAQGNDLSVAGAISADGRFVVFVSSASNLVPGDTNAREDTFVHDLRTGQTTRVSVSGAGGQQDGDSGGNTISRHGRFVAFESDATNLIAGRRLSGWQIYVRDRKLGRTTIVSVDGRGRPGDDESRGPTMTAHARYIAFSSYASNLAAAEHGHRKGSPDAFVHDTRTGKTTLVSVSSRGRRDNGMYLFSPVISANNRFVAFASDANDLVPHDANAGLDVFVHDRKTGRTFLGDLDSHGREGRTNTGAQAPAASGLEGAIMLSYTGRYLLFSSDAANLTAGGGYPSVFVRDLFAKRTVRVAVGRRGQLPNGESRANAISAHGRIVTFDSDASNLVPGDTNGVADAFTREPLFFARQRR